MAYFYESKTELSNQKFGFLAYGSGSKSKVFEGTIQSNWAAAISNLNLFQTLEKSHEIGFETYEKLHKKEQKTSVQSPKREWILDKIENENPSLIGARYYKWID